MKFRWDNRYLHWGVTAFLVIAASMLFYYGIFHMQTLLTGIRTLLSILAPIIYGLIIAFLLNPVVNFLEKKVIFVILEKKEISLKKRGIRIVRWCCVILSLFFLLVVIYALIMMILPQLIRSVMNIIYSFPYYMKAVEKWLTAVETNWDLNASAIDTLNRATTQVQDYLTSNILPQMQEMLKNISAGMFDVLNFLKNFLIGAIVSIYVLADKESFEAKAKMVVFAAFPTKYANVVIRSMRFTNKTFAGFISGKILDSAIIGVLCYIGTTVLDMPYAILVSVIVGVTNVIPFFGPYLGAIPCFLLILLVNPMQSLYFALFILALQQFDGNILGPKILGDSTGLSSFMVILSIMIGGGLFGIPGMIIGVPVFAVFYSAMWHLIRHFLSKKDMPVDMDQYYNVDCMDLETHVLTEKKVDLDAKRREEERLAHSKTLFMKVWNTVVGFLLLVWKYVSKYSIIAWENVKKYALIFWANIKKYTLLTKGKCMAFIEKCKSKEK